MHVQVGTMPFCGSSLGGGPVVPGRTERAAAGLQRGVLWGCETGPHPTIGKPYPSYHHILTYKGQLSGEAPA